MPLQVVPNGDLRNEIASDSFGIASNAILTLPDTLRTGQGPLNFASNINNRHPLEGRVANWDATQQATRMEMYRRVFGAGEPIKRQMELAIVDNEFTPMSTDLMHKDILLGKDNDIDWEDVYRGPEAVPDFHTAMEKKMGM